MHPTESSGSRGGGDGGDSHRGGGCVRTWGRGAWGCRWGVGRGRGRECECLESCPHSSRAHSFYRLASSLHALVSQACSPPNSTEGWCFWCLFAGRNGDRSRGCVQGLFPKQGSPNTRSQIQARTQPERQEVRCSTDNNRLRFNCSCSSRDQFDHGAEDLN